MSAAKRPEETEDAKCMEHSGMVVRFWVTSVLGGVLLVSLNLMVGFQIFQQIPAMRQEMSKRISEVEYKVSCLERDVTIIKEQRNLDHQDKDPLR